MDKLEGLDTDTARFIVEHLADGIVPDHGLEYFTVGRERWLESLRDDLDSIRKGRPRLRIVNGKYGDGKTHMMRLLSLAAMKDGMAVSYVTIEKETPLSRWDRVYAAVVRNMSTAGCPGRPGVASLLDPDAPDPAISATYASKAQSVRSVRGINRDFATAVYRLCTKQTTSIDAEQELLVLKGWLEGLPLSKTVLRGLGISTAIDRANGKVMLGSLVQVLQHFGYLGVVILVDEVEGLMDQSEGVREQSYDTLRLLIDKDIPAGLLVVLSTTPAMFTDEERGFQGYGALWDRVRPSGPVDQVNYRGTVVDLFRTPMKATEYRLLGERIREVHARARAWIPGSRVTDGYLESISRLAAGDRLALGHSPTRVFVKLVTNELEIAEQNPEYEPRTEGLEKRFVEIDQTLSETREAWEEGGG